MIGTETGRNTPARLARFREEGVAATETLCVLGRSRKKWIRDDEKRATVIIDDKVGELSFIYNYQTKKWIIAYFASARYDITLRMAAILRGLVDKAKSTNWLTLKNILNYMVLSFIHCLPMAMSFIF